MTKKTLSELRAKTDQLMNSPLHMHHEARIAALAAERKAADFEIARLTRERDEARYQLARSYQSEKCTLDPQTCKEAECFACGVLMCPHAEPMHLHHDGCPACHGAALEKENSMTDRYQEIRDASGRMLDRRVSKRWYPSKTQSVSFWCPTCNCYQQRSRIDGKCSVCRAESEGYRDEMEVRDE